MLLPITVAVISSYAVYQENPEVKAIQLFNAGHFTEAEIIFQQLLETNPQSPIPNYYYGASRTENGHFGEKEIACLMSAGKNITPERLHYYLGIQHHALENWDQALKFYNQFRLSVPQKEQVELELDKKIQLCFNQINPFDETSGTPQAEAKVAQEDSLNSKLQRKTNRIPQPEAEQVQFSASTGLEIPQNQEYKADETLFLPREALPNLPGVKPAIPAGESVRFQVNNLITYLYTSEFQTDEGKAYFDKAAGLQQKQNKNLEETESLRKAYKTCQSAEERESIATKIIALENETLLLEEQINTIYAQSRQIENEYWENAGPESRNDFLQQQAKILAALKEEKVTQAEPEPEVLIELITPLAKADEKPSPAELVYKIQIGAYSKGVPAYRQRLFNKLSVIRTIDTYTDEKGVVVYTTGNLTRYEDAIKLQNQVKQEGIQDASVVSYFNGKRIPLEQAKQLEANNDI